MKGDFTRFSFDPKKHYKQVFKQQGRVDLDADWNEQGEIQAHERETVRRDVIGRYGVPKGEAFEVQPTGNGNDLLIRPGRAYVDGVLAQLDGGGPNGNLPVSYRNQPDYVPLPPINPQEGRTDLVYLDVWERVISAVEDESILEPALGGADTAVRVKTITQVKIKTDVGDIQCDDDIPGFPPQSQGRLTTSADPAETQPDLCLLPPQGGYRGLENSLYRVEIHAGGNLDSATFKWSRDNGAVVFPIASFLSTGVESRVKLKRLGRDELLTVKANDWVEITGEETDLQNQPGTLVKVKEVDKKLRIVTLLGDVSAHSGHSRPKLRRWDMTAGAVGLNNGNIINLEKGIRVTFSGTDFQSGDYWTFTARTGAAGLEILNDAPPQGIKHHYAPVALITWNKQGGIFDPEVKSCRRPFPPLTHICAEDVCFDNSNCNLPGAETVQEAIDALCQRKCCTLVIDPGPGWQQALQQIPPSGGIICFRPGEYRTSQPVRLENRGPMVFIGAGESTKLVASNSECAIQFVNCGGIAIRDIAARSLATPTHSGVNEGILGVLDFTNCWNVTLERLILSCPAGVRRAAACISVHGNPGRTFDVRVTDCRLKIGAHQTGILVTNPTRAWITRNTIDGVSRSPGKIPRFVADTVNRSLMRRHLVSHLDINYAPEKTHRANFEYAFAENARMRFRTRSGLEGPWSAMFEADPPPADATAVEIRDHVYRLADRLLLENAVPAFQPIISAFLNSPCWASQGITVGGVNADDVIIRDNVIAGVRQGIHIGLSKSGPRTASNVERATNVSIAGNTVNLDVDAFSTRERHGIFVGNAHATVIRDNRLTLSRTAFATTIDVDGIRSFGYLGPALLIRDNIIERFTVGVRVQLRGAAPNPRAWRVVDNIILSPSQQKVIASSGVITSPNYP